ncbi:MAG: hypothetical protein J6K32_05400 [Clostridia bacterium]|nr:hypothetical protein [Clostridia bacterium]
MAQKRRSSKQKKTADRRSIALCAAGGIGAILLSLIICLIVFDIRPAATTSAAVSSTPLPYDAGAPFSISDLTTAQLTQIRQQGRMNVSDGPRGISIGDSLDKVLERYPTDYVGEQPDDMQILYCASYFENQNGLMTALPPRGLLTVDNGAITVTLLAPTAAYPAGTKDSYGSYEHVYCLYTVDPDSMAISEIVLGIDQ